MKKLKNKINNDAELKLLDSGKVDATVESNMNLEKGLFTGIGVSLMEPNAKPKVIYNEWDNLNSHKLTLGTTRQGKSRSMAADLEQQIALGANVIVEEPKGSVGQEMFGYILQYAIKYGREQDIRYLSPYFKEKSEWFNPIYRYKNEQVASMVSGLIQGKDEFYANIAKNIVLSVTMGLEFLEEVGKVDNPYDYKIMLEFEHAKILTRTTNELNKYVFQENYNDSEHGIKIDIIRNMKRGKPEREIKKIDEAYKRHKSRELEEGITTIAPLRSFLTLRDLAEFETIDRLTMLFEMVNTLYEEKKSDEKYFHLLKKGREAIRELFRVSSRDSGFFSKVTTTYSTLMSDLISGDVGELLNESRINVLADDLSNPNKGVILFVQPFPMIYKTASEALGKILFFTLNSMAGYIGASGVAINRRTYVNVDEAGSVLTNVIRELANKGGGLGFSLFLYTQSVADIEDTLEEVGARILLDNMNTKVIYNGNDPKSLQMISDMLGTRKKAGAMGTATDQRNTRVTISVKDEAIAAMGVLSKIDKRKFILKMGSDIFLVAAPFVPDTIFNTVMPMVGIGDISLQTESKIDEISKMQL